MSTAEQKFTSTLERDADRALKPKRPSLLPSQGPVVTGITAAELAAKVRGGAPVGAPPAASVNDWLRVRHIVAAHRAEAMRPGRSCALVATQRGCLLVQRQATCCASVRRSGDAPACTGGLADC
jgi:hypothetical protein